MSRPVRPKHSTRGIIARSFPARWSCAKFLCSWCTSKRRIFPVGLARPLMPAGEKCWSRSASASSGQAWRLSSTLVRRAGKHLLSWAQQFPDDPHSPAVLAFIKKTEAQRFGSEMNSAREAIAGAVTLFDETKEKILQNCSAESNNGSPISRQLPTMSAPARSKRYALRELRWMSPSWGKWRRNATRPKRTTNA